MYACLSVLLRGSDKVMLGTIHATHEQPKRGTVNQCTTLLNETLEGLFSLSHTHIHAHGSSRSLSLKGSQRFFLFEKELGIQRKGENMKKSSRGRVQRTCCWVLAHSGSRDLQYTSAALELCHISLSSCTSRLWACNCMAAAQNDNKWEAVGHFHCLWALKATCKSCDWQKRKEFTLLSRSFGKSFLLFLDLAAQQEKQQDGVQGGSLQSSDSVKCCGLGSVLCSFTAFL
jgi:hypothetical protein